MQKIGLVEIVRNLPPPRDAIACTALQIRVDNQGAELVHGFAMDDPQAATLVPDVWLRFSKNRTSNIFGSIQMLAAEEGLSFLTMEQNAREQVVKIRRLLDTYVRPPEQGDHHAAAVAIQQKLEEVTSVFGYRAYPLEVVGPLLPKEVLRGLGLI